MGTIKVNIDAANILVGDRYRGALYRRNLPEEVAREKARLVGIRDNQDRRANNPGDFGIGME